MMRVMGDGVLGFPCPLCDKLLEVGLHVVTVAADPETKTSPLTQTRYGHRVEFIAVAPHLHAEFWGHLVREHQPLPHPYLSPDNVVDMVMRKGGVVGRLGDHVEVESDEEYQAAMVATPQRTFVDDLGRRWEWCGGTEGTWQWRIVAIPDLGDDGLSMWQQEYERIQERNR